MDLALNNLQRLICHKTQPTSFTVLNLVWMFCTFDFVLMRIKLTIISADTKNYNCDLTKAASTRYLVRIKLTIDCKPLNQCNALC